VTNVTRETGNKRKHGGGPALNFEKYWHREIEALKADYKKVMASHPEAKKAMEKAYEVLTDIAHLAGCAPKEVGESTEWAGIVQKVEASRINLCGMLEGETLFSSLYGVYMHTFTELKNVLKNNTEKKDGKCGNATATPKTTECFKEQKRKRRSSTEGDRPDAAKKQGARAQRLQRTTPEPQVAATKKFFAPLRNIEMEEAAESKGEEEGQSS